VRLVEALGTDLFTGDGDDLRQGVELRIAGGIPTAEVTASVDDGDPVTGVVGVEGDVVLLAFVRQPVSPPAASREVEVRVHSGRQWIDERHDVRFGEPGWTLHLAPHFHYDPVWWNTQAGFLTEWESLAVATETRMLPEQRTAFELMRAHLDRARADADYRFVVAEIDYLKPWWDSFPEERELFRRLVAEGRIDVVGGSYNEPSSTLVGIESVLRNVASGLEFQRGVLGADPTVSWQLDVFGHDPHYPSIMAAAGMRASSWARGPFHENGPMIDGAVKPSRDPDMPFASEFLWMGPDGGSLLTGYLAAHYSSGWWMHAAPTLEAAETEVLELFRRLKTAAATRHVFLPVGADHIMPNRWVTEIARDWARRYTWPRFEVSTPSRYFAAVREEVEAGRAVLTTQTRDMNPIFAGTAVSYIDTKQANRAAEVALREAEIFAALAGGHGFAYPRAELEHAWRQLAFGAHHDAITGSESDQVYIDLLGGWRGAWQTAVAVRERAVRAVAGSGSGETATVVNGLAADRRDAVRIPVARPSLLRASDGAVVASTLDGDAARGWVLDAVVDVPATGLVTLELEPDETPDETQAWTPVEGMTVSNEYFRLTVDPARGGAVSSLRDLLDGVELIAPGRVGNDIQISDEYPNHPSEGYGPWFVAPRGGPPARSGDTPAESLRVERGPAGERVVVTGRVAEMPYTQTLTLWRGVRRVDATTRLDFAGSDQIVRIVWPCPVPGAVPVAQTGGAVIGRNPGYPGADAAVQPWGLDSTCHEWFGLSAPVRLRVTDPGRASVFERAVAVGEIVCGDLAASAEHGTTLARALVRCGVTATNTLADGPRTGDLAKDSNQPDLRIAVGDAASNSFVARVLAAADPWFAEELERRPAGGVALLLVPARVDAPAPGEPVTGVLDLPVLIVAGDVATAVSSVAADLADAVLDVEQDLDRLPASRFEDRSVAILNRGLPGYAVDVDGTLSVSALRSSTGWPSGVWIDPPRRSAPDGSAFQLQHWTHDLEYAVIAGAGDWRRAGFAAAAQEFGAPLTVVEGGAPGVRSLMRVDPPSVRVSALARTGLFADGEESTVTLRLAETHGRDTQAAIEFDRAVNAVPSDLLGWNAASPPAPGSSTRASVSVGGFGLTSLRVRFDGEGAVPDEASGSGPAFSRYWLHNAGTAPVGGQPVSIRILERGVEGGAVLVDVVLASERGAGPAGRLRVEADGGAIRGPSDVAVPSFGESHVVPVRVEAAGVVALTATFESPGLPGVEDALVLGTGGERLAASVIREGIDLSWDRDDGLALLVRNDHPVAIRGDLLLLSPWGTWPWIDDWSRVVEVAAASTTRIPVHVTRPPAMDAATSWLIAKLGALGTVSYSATTPLSL
jgi:alpha-mannosidase